jgi:hypothetical protein
MRKNKLVAMLGWKYEPRWLIDDFKKNMDFVDDFAILDCRDRDELWIHEGEYRLKLIKMATELKADWVLCSSADERFEKNAGKVIRSLIDDNKERFVYEFDLKEMYTPTKYRVGGIWNKTRLRLFPLLKGQVFKYQPIQCSAVPQNGDYVFKHINLNIYHLKMIEKENRKLRTQVFNKLDPLREYQGPGYDYLNDETGLELEKIPKGREYYPKYRKYIFNVPKKYL